MPISTGSKGRDENTKQHPVKVKQSNKPTLKIAKSLKTEENAS